MIKYYIFTIYYVLVQNSSLNNTKIRTIRITCVLPLTHSVESIFFLQKLYASTRYKISHFLTNVDIFFFQKKYAGEPMVVKMRIGRHGKEKKSIKRRQNLITLLRIYIIL